MKKPQIFIPGFLLLLFAVGASITYSLYSSEGRISITRLFYPKEEKILDDYSHVPYLFKPLNIKNAPQGNEYDGEFLFINRSSDRIYLNGFGEPVGEFFHPRFVGFEVRRDNRWIKLDVGYCGTGAQKYPIEPNTEYVFDISLWPFDEQDQPVTGRVGVDNFVSEPFVLNWQKDKRLGKFDESRDRHVETVRKLLVDAGFDKRRLTGNGFIERFLASLIDFRDPAALGFSDFEEDFDVLPTIDRRDYLRFDIPRPQPYRAGQPLPPTGQERYELLLVLTPSNFSADWFREEMNRRLDIGTWGDAREMVFGERYKWFTEENTLYIQLKYWPPAGNELPSVENSKKLFKGVVSAHALLQ